jgi:two-component system copper resistance phosphate regulon response regulator CusR
MVPAMGANHAGDENGKLHVLVAEDDRGLRESLVRVLRFEGYEVQAVGDGAKALEAVSERVPDAVVLDVMMPVVDGLTACRLLREHHRLLPILMLTARHEVADRVAGLDAGADDYLVKPFAFSELLARIRSVLRRGPAREPERLKSADLEIDVVRHRATRAGRKLDLTPKEFALLLFLARRPGEVQSRTLIAEHVWDMNFEGGTNVVDVHVRRLRSKVDDPFERKLIHTVRGVGYVLDEAR